MAKSVTEYREIGKKRDGGRLDASFTVEAALVMSALFLFIASLITGVFDIHARVAGNMVLQEALECGTRLEEGQTLSEMESNAQQDYRGYFWCGGGNK